MMYDISYKVKAKEVPKGQIDCLCITADGSKYEYEFLPDYVHYDIGHWKEYSGSEARRKRLSLASNIWQVGWYLPPYKFGRPENYDLTNHILKNKETDEYAFLLALSMYVKAKDHRYNFDIFDADVIVPVPNFDLNNNSRAVSISKKLANIMKIIGGQTIIQQNLIQHKKNIKLNYLAINDTFVDSGKPLELEKNMVLAH